MKSMIKFIKQLFKRDPSFDLPDMDDCPECHMNQVMLNRCNFGFSVICSNCGTSAPSGTSKLEAIDIWNIGRTIKEK